MSCGIYFKIFSLSFHFGMLDLKVLMHSEIFIETSVNIYTAKITFFPQNIFEKQTDFRDSQTMVFLYALKTSENI